jgi:hypothetical protein
MSKSHKNFGGFIGLSRTQGSQGGIFSIKDQQLLQSSNSWARDLIGTGLVLDLDSNNSSSYSGSGTTWTDTASGIVFSSSGTTTPYQTIGSGKGFAFNGSGYWQSNSNHGLADMGGDTTLIMWLYGASQSQRRTVFEKAGTSYQSYEQEIACTWETNNTISYYSRRSPSYDYSDGSQARTTGWFMWAIKMSTGKTSAARTGFYSVNGSAWQSNYVSRSNTALLPAGAIRVGTGYAGTVLSGGVGRVAIYSRMLSDAEILQNYQSTRAKYGV